MKRIKNKIMVPVYIMAVLLIGFIILQTAMVFTNLRKIKVMNTVDVATTMKAADLKLSVVQVQQWLTDISATRAAEGFDDGYDEAEHYAVRVRSLITELKGINPGSKETLDSISASFEPYYETGKRMAAAYIAGGPLQGNLMMEEFDGVAEEINSRVDSFVELANENISASINRIEKSIGVSVVMAGIAIIAAILICIMVRLMVGKNVVHPIEQVRNAANKLAEGDLKAQISYHSLDETGQMADDMRITISALNETISDIIHCVNELKAGNLTVVPDANYRGDFVLLKDSIQELTESFRDTIKQINQSADLVADGSGQVSNGAQVLSQGAAEQASSVDILASSLRDISEEIQINADQAKSASRKADTLGNQINESNQKMHEMTAAMNEISVSSKEIGKIIKVIEDIAFQTNILALNAAVEAARAGSAGKGFAVVADEVRNLAGKSAEASNSTASLIERSLTAVENGTHIADETAQKLESVAVGAKEIVDSINQMSRASGQQAAAVTQTTQGIGQISSVVQSNSATAEESAAASEELSGQAQILKGLVEHFKLQ